ncbi:MAG TPA: hypothetical protein VFS43_04565 [Polyangiaceae bacterium]|nr:hypothetical protein [Polyangiaceae bacterium]
MKTTLLRGLRPFAAGRAPLPSLLFLFTLAACTPEPNWVGAPRVPTPVLLGPVDRVGGHRADAGGKAVGQFGTSVDQTASYSRSETQVGTTVYVREERTASRDGTGKLSVHLLRAAEGRGDRDAHVKSLDLSSFILITASYGFSELSVGVSGEIVPAKGGAR